MSPHCPALVSSSVTHCYSLLLLYCRQISDDDDDYDDVESAFFPSSRSSAAETKLAATRSVEKFGFEVTFQEMSVSVIMQVILDTVLGSMSGKAEPCSLNLAKTLSSCVGRSQSGSAA